MMASAQGLSLEATYRLFNYTGLFFEPPHCLAVGSLFSVV